MDFARQACGLKVGGGWGHWAVRLLQMAVSLQKPGFAKVSGATKKVLDRLKAAEDNRIPLCDHSTPEEVRALRASPACHCYTQGKREQADVVHSQLHPLRRTTSTAGWVVESQLRGSPERKPVQQSVAASAHRTNGHRMGHAQLPAASGAHRGGRSAALKQQRHLQKQQ